VEGRGKERERERERETEKQRERQRDDESSKDKAASEGVWEQKTTCKARLRRSLVCILFLPLLFARLPQIAVNTHTHTHTHKHKHKHTPLMRVSSATASRARDAMSSRLLMIIWCTLCSWRAKRGMSRCRSAAVCACMSRCVTQTSMHLTGVREG